MNKIDQKLAQLAKEKRLGLMTHVIVGYPSIPQTLEIVQEMERAGVDFVELQIPFSDPLADGPTIMKACEVALENGTKVKDAFLVAKKLSQQVSIPLLFMGYFNTVFKYGLKKFCADAKASGVSGLIIPDAPLEEADGQDLERQCLRNDLCLIRLLAPSSTKERMQLNAKKAKGFLYCTARQGITGAMNKLDPQVADYLKTVKKNVKVPLAVGFGISSKERVEMIRPYCQIAVVGSAIVDLITSSPKDEVLANIHQFIQGLEV
ncbi:tryptophan synthase subunit alpha [Candidatus Daviesbacteria bacterium RIFCSPHIGHO2_01_FULL_44_29]|uniref:Tryptophan synthase alpha chain n=1 Tax=Candidatus Daviesbacteria bacterium RIFCSPHIGHO2_02_FULL_43_12 TaxID=1797776 RepID=A0A1F5KID8_9BACT|nr:MAG: tryptophan synthase subunit alpha [Candidatus Daviesbacteria bacterium RIFCSPHIGHO2_01_FULL_44_29]OGE39217.1 MAG: tryptophan synthase subunit alpha [Candidatus Daviesbacteria bacterium RIFCSPHIGHO2_12_FULL_47_45]OGE40580.1 MAG: tryptophan synthase subunit alpha [Candidatus Daviesbacteria bacterium RIFCSPHIGHO2_02_FULL_43_12]OGE70140.1 MAG: tryptophan synthase subunit alpha [Candidatus Daviesbacteria bacterium RIFCSPLOWO2_01_FULL_43_15]